MDLQQTSASKPHDTHTLRRFSLVRIFSVDSPNNQRIEILDVENIQPKQIGTTELNPRDENIQPKRIVTNELNPLETRDGMKHGQELLIPTSAKFSEACIWNFLYLFIIIVSSTLLSMPITLIPLHNSIEFPEFWWEIIIPFSLGSGVFVAVNLVLECQMIFNFECFKSLKVVLRLYLFNLLALIITVCMCYTIWTASLGYNHPIPYLGVILFIVTNITICISIWFQFPYQLRSQKDVRNRIVAYFLFRLWLRFYGIQTLAFKKIILMIPLDMQWTVAIILPILRELNLGVTIKLLKKATDLDSTVPLIPKLTATVIINLGHACFLATIISSLVTDFTSYSILAVDFIINLFLTYKIIKMHRKVSPTDAREKEKRMVEKTENILQLFAIETAELLAPIVYSITFAMAFYGPNSEITGNVRGNYWTFHEIVDMERFQYKLFQMGLIDFTSCIISAFALWKFSSVNLLKEGHKMMKFFFPFLSIKTGGIFLLVSFIL